MTMESRGGGAGGGQGVKGLSLEEEIFDVNGFKEDTEVVYCSVVQRVAVCCSVLQ